MSVSLQAKAPEMLFRYCRHPGYFGWFVWVLGTQLVLVNPVCTVAFTAVVSVLAVSFVQVLVMYYEL